MKKLITIIFLVLGVCDGMTDAKPLKVFILAGQSNMQGHAKVSTFGHLAMDPKTAPMLKEMCQADGSPNVCDAVWISAIGVAEEECHGNLTVGYGAKHADRKIGPEYTFGIYMHKQLGEPVLIIKTAWGGKSLHTDFRPPSMGTYQLNDGQKKQCRKRGQDAAAKQVEINTASGRYYRLMIEHVRKVLGDIRRVYPDYDLQRGYELAGFAWFQGWNDMVDSGVYPNRDKPGGFDAYSECLGAFIRDVRKDLDAPDLPFVIGVMGVGGPLELYKNKRIQAVHGTFRKAMAAPAEWPEFKGNVTAIHTADYWDVELGELEERWGKIKNKSRQLNKDNKLSREERFQALEKYKAEIFTVKDLELREKGISNAAYHYLGSAKIMARIGKAFAEALVSGGNAQYRFAFLGDLHFDRPEHHDMEWVQKEHPGDIRQIETYCRVTRENSGALLTVASETLNEQASPFAIIQAGDFVEGLCGSYELQANQFKDAIRFVESTAGGIPFLITKGNHDITGPGAEEAYSDVMLPWFGKQLGKKISSTSYTVRQGGDLFVFFDGYKPDLDWFENVLKEEPFRYLFFIVHEPVVPYNARSQWHLFSRDKSSERRDRLLSLLGKHHAIVLCGHLHQYSVVRRQTENGAFIQLAMNSVVHQEPGVIKLLSGKEQYGPELTRLEPRFSPESREIRRNILQSEKPRIDYFEVADISGWELIIVSDDAIRLENRPWNHRTVWRVLNMTPSTMEIAVEETAGSD